MTLILIGLISLVGYSGYLGVNSIWKFTHPQFHFSADSLKSLGYIAKGTPIPPIAGPTAAEGFNIPEEKTAAYLQSVAQFKSEFRKKHPYSKLLGVPDTDILNLGWNLCKAKETAYSQTGSFKKEEAKLALKAKLILKYWQIDGLNEYLDGISELAYQELCGDV